MQKASAGPVAEGMPALRLLHRGESYAGASGRRAFGNLGRPPATARNNARAALRNFHPSKEAQ